MLGFFPETLNIPLPENWEQQIKQIIQIKKDKTNLIEEAEIIPESE